MNKDICSKCLNSGYSDHGEICDCECQKAIEAHDSLAEDYDKFCEIWGNYQHMCYLKNLEAYAEGT